LAYVSCDDDPEAETKIDSPGMLAGDKPSKQVIIVGAGISGLVAAYELMRAGHEVIILEARDRTGGRVYTYRNNFSDGHYAEAGAGRIPPDHDMTLGYIDHFGLALNSFYPDSGLYVNLSGGSRTFVSPKEYINARPWPSSVPRNEYVKIQGGLDKLPDAFANSMLENIYLDTPVTSIEQDSEGVNVSVSDGTEFIADRVLCTVPLPVLNRIQFSPQLSTDKIDASNGGYNYAASTKSFIQFTNRFWESEGLNGWGNTDFPEEIWHSTWDREGPRGILMSYLRYSRATEIDLLSEEEGIQNILDRWENVFPGVARHVEHGSSHSWALDEWSGGAWASPTSNQNAALSSHIGEAEGRIHFAGEHASENHGWIQGALVSGLRAATEIHEGL